MQIIFTSLMFPLAGALLVLLSPQRSRWLHNFVLLVSLFGNLMFGISVYLERGTSLRWPLGGFGFELAFSLGHFAAFSVLCLAVMAFLIGIYTTVFMRGLGTSRLFFAAFLATITCANGAVLADDLVVLLFFWESLLLTLFVMIYTGHKDAWRTAVKALIISGIADLCLLIGVALTAWLAGTTNISEIHLELVGPANLAFLLMMIGALAKGGSMPFHSWIPDAAVDAPLPFMAIIPGALEKLLGIFLLTRISLDLFVLKSDSWLSMLLMIIGALTIILAVLMALVQKDFKRLLSFHAISQVGYMILGIGTATPVGIVGGLFHMLNNIMYKSCLFLTAGAVERQTGTTDLNKLGGLARRMPVTFFGFALCALAISGVWPFNGFISKELIYDGALERGWIFYAVALLGSFFTAASFLKLGHAVFVDRERSDLSSVREAPLLMLVPIVLISFCCAWFGVHNYIPLHEFIQPILGADRLLGHDFAGWPHNQTLVILSAIVVLLALLNHLWGVRRAGTGLKAVDHIHYAPGLHQVYEKAEKRCFDPYEVALKGFALLSSVSWAIDRAINWVYDVFAPALASAGSSLVRTSHDGSHVTYMMWLLSGTALVIVFLLFI